MNENTSSLFEVCSVCCDGAVDVRVRDEWIHQTLELIKTIAGNNAYLQNGTLS